MTIDWWGTIGIVALTLSCILVGVAALMAFAVDDVHKGVAFGVLALWGLSILGIMRRGDI